MVDEAEIIVVGSGCSGAMAAQTLVESGAKVILLDVGTKNEIYTDNIPKQDFDSTMESNENYSDYFIGKDFESLNFNGEKSGAQLTPPRKHIVKHTGEFLKYISDSFSAVESLAYGGLGAGWGLGCCVYSDEEMELCKLNKNRMHQAYNIISSRIGISAENHDNATPYTIGMVSPHLPPLKLDESNYLLKRFKKKSALWNKKELFLGRPALALLSEDFQDRKACAYDDMHFYHDSGGSAYRPGLTIDKLIRKNNFIYISNQLVLKFLEVEDSVFIETLDIQTKERKQFKAKKLVLAAGALSTARIVLRSLNYKDKISFLCNPYTYYPCLNPFMAGKKIMKHKTGMAQLSIFHDEGLKKDNIAMASIYSYRSLFLFRLMNDIPLNYKDGKELLRFLLSGMVIMGIHHPDHYDRNRFLERVSDSDSVTEDAIKIEFSLSHEKKEQLKTREKKFTSLMRSLGAWPLKRVDPGMGASIHYAGTLPYSAEEKPLTLDANGKLHHTKNIYVADSSGFCFLPAKGLTFSLMANAHNVANHVLNKK